MKAMKASLVTGTGLVGFLNCDHGLEVSNIYIFSGNLHLIWGGDGEGFQIG